MGVGQSFLPKGGPVAIAYEARSTIRRAASKKRLQQATGEATLEDNPVSLRQSRTLARRIIQPPSDCQDVLVMRATRIVAKPAYRPAAGVPTRGRRRVQIYLANATARHVRATPVPLASLPADGIIASQKPPSRTHERTMAARESTAANKPSGKVVRYC